MKEIKKERTVCDLWYEAIDGSQFRSKEECEKYDDTAKAVLRSKFKKLIVHEGSEYSIFHVGCEDSTIYAIKMNAQADATIVKQLWELDHEHLHKCERYSEYQDRAYNSIDAAYTEGDILFVGEDCEGEIYIIDSRANIIEDLQKIGCEKDIKKKD